MTEDDLGSLFIEDAAIRVLVVDDSVLYRKLLSQVITGIDKRVEIHVAANGKIALQKTEQLNPDLITLDLEMPHMGGLEFLEILNAKKLNPRVIVISGHTDEAMSTAATSIELGALDVIAKPQVKTTVDAFNMLKEALEPIINSIGASLSNNVCSSEDVRLMASEVKNVSRLSISKKSFAPMKRPHIIALAASTGGPAALIKLLGAIPCDFPVPLLVTVQLPIGFSTHLASSLDRKSSIRVVEGIHGDILCPGTAYIATAGKQMGISQHKHGDEVKLSITDDPPENYCKPSADYLFRSVAEIYGSRALGVILTGMGYDGTQGLIVLKRRGGYVIAQDKKSCVVFGMPGSAINAGVVDLVIPLDRINESIQSMLGI